MSELNLTLINVGHGDSLLLNFLDDSITKKPINYFGLIDSNDSTNLRPTHFYLTNFFNNYNEDIKQRYNLANFKLSTEFEFIMLSHDHSDHAQGLEFILKNYEYKNFYLSQPHTGVTSPFLVRKLKNNSKFKIIDDQYNFSFGGTTISVLWPPKGTIDPNENNNSLVLLIEFDKIAFLLTGDLETGVWQQLQNKLNSKIKLIKMPHHGARNSLFDNTGSTPWLNYFLQKNFNLIFGISCISKAKNSYYPNKDVKLELAQAKYEYFSTNEHSTITFTTDGQNISFKYSR